MDEKWDVNILFGDDIINSLVGCSWAEVRVFIEIHSVRSNEKCTYEISKTID